jgi:CO/xanthine dehydrogenase Mo-binding subunit
VLSRWLGFERTGEVRLSPGKVEIGQGIASALAQIAADELDVALSRVRVAPVDTGTSPDEEVTSGSLSIQDSGAAVRQAAADIRALCVAAAASRFGVPVNAVSVVDGSLRGPGNLGLSYWELAGSVDLDVPATGAARPKGAGLRTVVGTSVLRAEVAARLHGDRPYIHDLRHPRMRHGRVVRSPRPGGAAGPIDEVRFRSVHPHAQLVRLGGFIGVVATTEHEAVVAAAALAGCMTWEGGDIMPDTAGLHDWLAAQPSERVMIAQQGGAAPGSGRRIARRYEKPFIAHASIGPSVALAEWNDGQLTVTSHSQGVFNLRRDLALVFGLPETDVRVVHAEGAGCYGHNGADDVALDAALLARAAGAPVRVQWSRADELSQAPFGAAMRIEIAAELDEAGRITHWSHELISNGHVARPGRAKTPALLAAFSLDPPHPRYVATDPPLTSGGGAQRNSVPLYAIPNLTVSQRRVLSAPVRTSSLRSLGAFGNVFAIESFMDELAEAAGQDPLAFRLAHLPDERARAVLVKAAEMSGWGQPVPEGRGRGIAIARYKNTGAWCAVVAELDVSQEVRATALWIAADVGAAINPDGVVNQVEGGAVQSVSWTLKEEARPGPDGAPPQSWEDYPILRFSEVPAVTVSVMPRPDDPPLGAGECAQGPVAAALANALHAALGVRVRQLPLTRERIIAAMEVA